MSKICTDIPQSRILAKILSIESADMHYVRKKYDFMGNPVDGEWSEPKYGNPNSKYANYIIQNFESYERIPCWSLAALINVIKPYNENTYTIKGTLDGGALISFDEVTNVMYQENEIVDAVYEMILWLNEKKMI